LQYRQRGGRCCQRNAFNPIAAFLSWRFRSDFQRRLLAVLADSKENGFDKL
jgi:hypothetical protein